MASPDLDFPWLSSTGYSFFGSFSNQIDEENPANILDALEVPTSSISYNFNIPKPPPLPCKTSTKVKYPNKLPDICYVPKETVDTWDRIFKQGYGADVYIITDDVSYIPAHSIVLMFLYWGIYGLKSVWVDWEVGLTEELKKKVLRAAINERGFVEEGVVWKREDAFFSVPFNGLYHFESVASPVLENVLQQSIIKNGMRYIKIPGVPYEAVQIFIRFLYSSCYDKEEMKKFVLHLLVLSHYYSVPSLKRVCVYHLEQGWLTKENVVDVLQLVRKCDAPRLSLFCVRMIVKDFKAISSTEGWKVMKRVNTALEQELLESVVEADSRKQERTKKIEEKKVYLQLNEAMEALLHICRDGCRTIGPRDKVLKGSMALCGFPACKGLETLVRHFSNCKTRVPGGCIHCKRMWQLLELHSRMCNDPDSCNVPLCRHFKEKIQQQNKKDDTKWKLLVSKVIAAKNALGPFSTTSRHSGLS